MIALFEKLIKTELNNVIVKPLEVKNMPSVSISLPGQLIAKLQEKSISPTKIAQRGIELLLELGPEAVEQLKDSVEQMKQVIEIKQIHIDELKRSNTDLKARLIKKSIQLTMPDLHEKFSNKINPGFDIEEIRAATGEKWGMMDLAEAYDFVDLLDYKGVPE